jgi:hypothetical protein
LLTGTSSPSYVNSNQESMALIDDWFYKTISLWKDELMVFVFLEINGVLYQSMDWRQII